MNIKDNLDFILKKIPENVILVAVSKTKPESDILLAYNEGQRVFGENKAQELINKQPELPQNIRWHFIGHTQTNKVKHIAPFVSLIESIDSLKLLKEINKQALKNKRTIDCLLQFHIASEQTKFGLDYEEAQEILDSDVFKAMKNIRICGVMGMATFTEDESVVRNEFKNLKKIFDKLKRNYFSVTVSYKLVILTLR